jgi:hypothetical protein
VIAALNLFVSYYLALRRYGIALVMVVGGLATYGLMFWHHTSPGAVVESLLYGSLAMCVLLGAWASGTKLMRRKNEPAL